MSLSLRQRLAEISLLAALMLPPLFFYPRCENVFWMTESLTSRFFAGLALATALSSLTQRQPKSGLGGGIALLGFLSFWLLGAALNSFRKDLSLTTLWEFACYPAIFFATWQLSRQKNQPKRLLTAILFTGLLLAVYGLLQSLGWDFMYWSVNFGGRAFSFLGNPDFLGGHMALLIPPSLALALSAGKSKLKAGLLWLLSFLLISALFFSATRGALLGFALSLVVFIWLGRKVQAQSFRLRSRWLWIGAGILAIFLGLGAWRQPQNFRRIFRAAFGSGSAAEQRGVLLHNSLVLANQHPLWGVGPGQFRIYYPTVQASGLSDQELSHRPYVFSEHAHNDFVQMAAEAGWPAALALLGLYLWFYWKVLRGPKSLLSLGLSCGLLALHIHGLLNFPFLILPTQITAWSLAALTLRIKNQLSNASVQQVQMPTPPTQAWTVLGSLVFMAWAAACYPLFKVPVADHFLWIGKGESNLRNWDTAEKMLQRGLQLQPKNDALWYNLGLTQATKRYTMQAMAEWKRCLELNPYSVETRWRLGKAQLEVNDPADAETTLAPLESYAPNFWELWETLAAARYRQGKFDQALKTYDRAIALNASPQTMYENRAACLGNLGLYDEALKSLDEALKYNPYSASAYLSKAVTYLKMGNKKEGKAALKRCLELDPENQSAKDIQAHINANFK